MPTDTMTHAERKVVDFLLRSPGLQEIADFQLSPKLSARLDGLLYTNREASLTDEERTEGGAPRIFRAFHAHAEGRGTPAIADDGTLISVTREL